MFAPGASMPLAEPTAARITSRQITVAYSHLVEPQPLAPITATVKTEAKRWATLSATGPNRLATRVAQGAKKHLHVIVELTTTHLIFSI
jgi:hypothetical protein